MLVILVSVLAACGGVLADIPLTLEVEEMFERFIYEHKRDYADHEKLARFKIFKKNVEEAIRKNEEISYTVFGITQFMDLTTDEFTSKHGCLSSDIFSQSTCNILTDEDIPTVDAPESFDWREHQAVTRVKNQGRHCGSCWAFGTIGNVEGMYAIRNKELVEFSEQQLVDCDSGSYGCDGGKPDVALSYLVQAGGAMTEADYPYVAKKQSCTFDKSKVKVILSGCNQYRLTSQEKLKQLVYQNGPVTIALDAQSLQSYTGTILPASHCINMEIHHALALVGYGVENGTKYWIIKNSWTEKYGENGYVRIERGEGTNACGIMNDVGTSSAILA